MVKRLMVLVLAGTLWACDGKGVDDPHMPTCTLPAYPWHFDGQYWLAPNGDLVHFPSEEDIGWAIKDRESPIEVERCR